MSHLAHTVKLKQALLASNVTSLDVQKSVIENAYVLAIMKRLFTKRELFAAYTDEVEDEILARLSAWNEISPINGGLIINRIRGLFPALISAGINGGDFSPYPGLVVEGYDYQNCPVFKGLVDWLYNEMVTGND